MTPFTRAEPIELKAQQWAMRRLMFLPLLGTVLADIIRFLPALKKKSGDFGHVSRNKVQNFVVIGRPRLAKITEHGKLDFADYERRLALLQEVLQLIQHAYLGTSGPKDGIPQARAGIVRRLSALPGLFRYQLVPLWQGHHQPRSLYARAGAARLADTGTPVDQGRLSPSAAASPMEFRWMC